MEKVLVIDSCIKCCYFNTDSGTCRKLGKSIDKSFKILKDCPLETHEDPNESLKDTILKVKKDVQPKFNATILKLKCIDELGFWDFILQDVSKKDRSSARAKIIVESLLENGLDTRKKDEQPSETNSNN